MKADRIKEIAEELDCGFCAYIHKASKEVLFIPDTDKYFGMELDAWEKELDLLNKNRIDYHELRPMSSNQAFKIMADFTDQLTGDEDFQIRLFNSLSGKKPFQKFKFIVENSMKYRQKWFDFKFQKQMEYVREQLNFV